MKNDREPARRGRPRQELIEPYVRPKDLASALNVTRQCLWTWRQKGILPEPVRLGPNVIGWPRSVIEAWKAARAAA